MNIKQIAYISFFLLVFFLIHSFYRGVVTLPGGGDSRDYQIPIAEYILDGTVFSIPDGLNSAIYYPGASNAILSLFIFFQLPLNLFGWVGWIILFFLTKKLAKFYGLDDTVSFIFATGFVTTLSVLRQIHTQSIDMWLAVYFVACILLLENPLKKFLYFALLGFLMGMILGSKTNGILYLVVFFFVYFKDIWKYVSFSRLIAFFILFTLVGLSWYIRNWILYDNPFYPAELFGFKGYPGFPLQDMMMWKTPFIYQDGLYKIIEALISEYLFFAFSFIPVLLYLAKNVKSQLIKLNKFSRLYWLCLGNLLITLIFPIPTINIIPNMRYLFPVVILFSLATFLLAKKYKKLELVVVISLLNSIFMLPQIGYYPKLFVIVGIILSYLWFRQRKYIERAISY